MANGINIHKGHRARIKQKYFKHGSAPFSDHELLELLLFYSIPRADTNETAHKLIECFGSLEGVLSADPAQLESVNGIGHNSSLLISLIGDVCNRTRQKQFSNTKKYRTVKDVGEFLTSHYAGAKREYFSALYFNSAMELIGVSIISEGSTAEASVTPTRVTREAVLKGASTVIVAHNHLGGSRTLSASDRNLTNLIEATLSAVGITLTEHFIVTPEGYAPSMLFRFGNSAASESGSIADIRLDRLGELGK